MRRRLVFRMKFPVEPEFSHCKFIKDAYESKSCWKSVKKDTDGSSSSSQPLDQQAGRYGCRDAGKERKLYNDRDKEYADLCTEATNLDLSLAKIENKIHLLPTRWQASKPRLRFMNSTRKQLRTERNSSKNRTTSKKSHQDGERHRHL